MLSKKICKLLLGILMVATLSIATKYTEFEYILPLDRGMTFISPSLLNRRSGISPAFSLLSNHLKVTLTDPIYKQEKKKMKISSLAEFISPKVHRKLVNIANYFVTADNGTFVYFDKDLRSWVFQSFKEDISKLAPKTGQRIPLSRCISTVHGGEGYVATQLDASVYAESTINTPIDLILLVSTADVLASVGSGLSLGSAVGFTGSVTCIVGPNKYAQPYLYPYYFDVPKGQRIKAKFIEKKGFEVYGNWEETPSFQRIVATGLLECAIGNDSSVCDSMIPGLSMNLRKI